jgi:HAD superfamily hydrolase (TIGR01549 family)
MPRLQRKVEYTSPEKAMDYWRAVVRKSFGPAADSPRFEDFFRKVFEEFALPHRFEFFPEVPGVLTALRDRGYRLGIISNWDFRLRPVLAGLGQLDLFHPVVISGEVGREKPDPGIFEIARKMAGAAPADRLLHIGDSPADDYHAALAADFEARLLKRSEGLDLAKLMTDII